MGVADEVGVAATVGEGVTVLVIAEVGVDVAVAGPGVPVAVLVGVIVEVGVGTGCETWNSYAPISHLAVPSPLPSCGRVMPR